MLLRYVDKASKMFKLIEYGALQPLGIEFDYIIASDDVERSVFVFAIIFWRQQANARNDVGIMPLSLSGTTGEEPAPKVYLKCTRGSYYVQRLAKPAPE